MKHLRNPIQKKAFVSVPASSGNIGPGFDVLGLALPLYNDLSLTVLDPAEGPPVIHVEGEGKDIIPRDETNEIFRAIQILFLKAHLPVPKLEMRCVNRIPLARGLGSSSAAVVSGLLGANRLLKNRFPLDQIAVWASQVEGHSDNVVPALFGGVRASMSYLGRVYHSALPIPKLDVVLAIPEFPLSTKEARRVLPERVPLEDAVYNMAAVALLPEAFRKHTDWLIHLLDDRLHQPYRAELIPGFFQVRKAARFAGGKGFVLSGAGSTVLSFAKPKDVRNVGQAMEKAFGQAGVKCEIRSMKINRKGAVVR